MKFFLTIVILIFAPKFYALVTETDSTSIIVSKPRLYIEGSGVDFDYIRREVTWVNYVRDKRQSNIYLLITRRSSGSNGDEYTFRFSGKGVFEGITDTLLYYTRSIDSVEEERTGYIKTLKRGLIPFINQTQLARYINIIYENPDENEIESILNDPWDYWIFRVELDGYHSGESTRKSYSMNSILRGDRITEEWKLRFYFRLGYQQEEYDYEDEDYLSISRWKNFNSDIIKSIGSHFGTGLFIFYNSSTYNNILNEIGIYSAVEYSLFPYVESSSRELTFAYKIGYNRYNYIEETVYNRTKESIFKHSLSFNLEFMQEWGETEFDFKYVAKLNDFSRNRVNLYGRVSINLLEGFAFDFKGGYSKIQDQYSIPKSELSLDELLLQRREIATHYDYWGSIGFSYTFGSIYNNIVNPRF